MIDRKTLFVDGMRYLPEKKNQKKLASWNTTNRVVCINCMYFIYEEDLKYIHKTNIDVYKQALACLFYVFSVKFMLVTIKKE